jgi:quercetin dioxygenase-like cupin family protein
MSSYPTVESDPGVSRQVLSEAPALMVVSFQFEKGAEGKLHKHPHVQSTYVRSGRFQFQVGDQTREVRSGDSFIIASGKIHGCKCLEAGELIDTFAPRRDDFL